MNQNETITREDSLMRTGTTYKDIIEEKIAEWLDNIELLNQQAQKASADDKARLTWKTNQLRSAIETATLQLHELNNQENADNTLIIKDKILKIFDSIDKDLTVFDKKTPYML